MGPLPHPPRHDPKITIGGQTYAVSGIEVHLRRRRLKQRRPLKPETVERIARGFTKIMGATPASEKD